MSDIETAEHKSRVRAALFYCMAAALLMSAWFDLGSAASGQRTGVWLVMVVVISLNLTPLATMVRRAGWARLLDDESAQAHRRTSFAAGFWGAMLAAAAIAIVTAARPIAGFDVARVVITAGLCAALVSFATLEMRAARG